MARGEHQTFHRPARLAVTWNVSRKKIYRLIASGELTAVRIGRELRVPDTAKRRFEQHNKVR